MEINREKEIRILYENFYLAYNKTQDKWYARHYNEELYEDDIIIDVEQLKGEPIELFDGFILDTHEFKEVENIKNTVTYY
jgi:hypothetical protein